MAAISLSPLEQRARLGSSALTPIGPVNNGSMIDPQTGNAALTGAQKGTNAGEALKALATASGLPLLGSSNASGAGYGTGGGIAQPTVQLGDTSAASSAAFGRAKDQTGLNTRASLTALTDQMAGNQMSGSGIEGQGVRDIVEHGAGQLNEVGREQAVHDANAANANANTAYQGAITQRGQNINAAQQAAARQQQVLEGLLSVVNSSGLLY